ncbi:hypothetical protein CNMCM8980_004992 [Aspergillus fumigatiaffinis]|jgi:hypothetical protein|uniref:Endonuclease/exonuclease/phosphatase domain-containing protein n=1 Tax=Aspergillus fumigatiaffinis TaxID=340414 RepID=A0A8H4MBA9_9EURO|nr:hypothetical protein CNMCM5878_004376 [Aspergillus fumigatiaffinis]KAF4236036.1 hypothetical protein CNMCM6457_002643 [Aspergillus fumigatiaffinis]KAF4240879.1 hypothetical protein CNMCM6805_004683 [Aspergillus fumigatiaffinis]KAF4248872.1 hypothetical protein CNMCM8980_004992 [Aspergillus fumigatiaffinis]
MVYLELIRLAIYDVTEHDDQLDVRLVGDFNRHDQLWWRQRDDKKRTVLMCGELGLERVLPWELSRSNLPKAGSQ